jgi:hypothetical protein
MIRFQALWKPEEKPIVRCITVEREGERWVWINGRRIGKETVHSRVCMSHAEAVDWLKAKAEEMTMAAWEQKRKAEAQVFQIYEQLRGIIAD